MKKCSVCGQSWPDGITFCGACGGAVMDVPAAPQEPQVAAVNLIADEPPIKKKPRRKAWIAVLAVVLVIAIVVGGFCTNWLGLFSPLSGLMKAAERTLYADSITVACVEKYNSESYYSESEYEMRIALNEDERTVAAYVEENYTYTDKEGHGDPGDHQRTYVTALEGDRKYYYRTNEDGEVTNATISEQHYKDSFKLREQGIDWEEIIEQFGLERYVDADEMDNFIKEVSKKYLDNTQWLEDTLGYSREGNTYTFSVDIEKLCESVIEAVEESYAFSGAFTQETKQQIEQFLHEMKKEKMDPEIEISVTVDGRYLSGILVEIRDLNGIGTKEEYEITFSDVNGTEVADKDIRRVKSKVNAYLDEEEIEYGHCEGCWNFGELYEWKNEMYCYSCYDWRREDAYDDYDPYY